MTAKDALRDCWDEFIGGTTRAIMGASEDELIQLSIGAIPLPKQVAEHVKSLATIELAFRREHMSDPQGPRSHVICHQHKRPLSTCKHT